jgi:hypothetical protein
LIKIDASAVEITNKKKHKICGPMLSLRTGKIKGKVITMDAFFWHKPQPQINSHN